MQESDESSGNQLIFHPRGSLRGPTKLLYLEPMQNDSSEDDNSKLFEYWQVVRHRLRPITAMVVLGGVAGALVSFGQTPIYQARASLEIQNPNDSVLNVRIGDLEAEPTPMSPESYLPTQVKILQSRTLQERAYAKLKEQSFPEGFQTLDRLSAWRAMLGIPTPSLPATVPPSSPAASAASSSTPSSAELTPTRAGSSSSEAPSTTLPQPSERTTGSASWAQNDSYVLGPLDVVAINVWRDLELSRIEPVRPDGKISLPLIGDMQASGLTPKMLQIQITRALEDYVRKPEVTVILQEANSHRFNLLGEVARPGSYLPAVKAVKKPAPMSDPSKNAIEHVRMIQKEQQTEVRVEGKGQLSCTPFRLSQPDRLVLDFPGATLRVLPSAIPSGAHPVRAIRVGQFKADVARVVIELDGQAPYAFLSKANIATVTFSSSAAAKPAVAAKDEKKSSVVGASGLAIPVPPAPNQALRKTQPPKPVLAFADPTAKDEKKTDVISAFATPAPPPSSAHAQSKTEPKSSLGFSTKPAPVLASPAPKDEKKTAAGGAFASETPAPLSSTQTQSKISTPKLLAPRVSIMPPVELKVRVVQNSRIVEILCDSTDPRVAAAFANTLANQYIDSNLEARWDAINRARERLTGQLEELRIKLQKSEDQLQAYGRAFNIMFTSGKDSVEQEKLKQIQEELSKAQAERIERQSAYKMAATTSPDSVPQVIDNTRLSDYQAKLAELRRQLAELSYQFTPEHYKVKQIQAQINELETTFREERDNILARIRNEYGSALMREKLLDAAYRKQARLVAEQAERGIYYNILEREVDTNRQLYDSLLQRTKEAGIASAMRASNARIIDPAEPPRLPYKPNLLFHALMGSLIGFMASLVMVLVLEKLDRSLRAPGDVSFHLKLPELGVIPAAILASGNGYDGPGSGGVELITWRDKTSHIAESFRSTLTSILSPAQNGTCPRVILISSAIRGEGKTTAVSNLGIALAETDQRVLLIDADMRKPRLHEVFNVPNIWGLSDLLREKRSVSESPLEALVQRTEVAGLYILTSGPGTASVTNLLYSTCLSKLLQRFRSEFDIVLIDTPPMLDLSDARILGRVADAVILVVRAGQTSRDAALAVKRRLIEDGIPILGIILNAWGLRSKNR